MLLLLQLLVTVIVLFAFVYFATVIFWEPYRVYLPVSIPIGDVDVSVESAITTYWAFLVAVTILLGILFYIIFDRLVIKPIKAITVAMNSFVTTQSLPPLESTIYATKEIGELAKIFVQFTNTVEQVHERDMEMSRVKSDFISTAAHQLRTPLTGIRWALEALAKESLTETQKSLVDDAANKSRDLVAIVGTLLDISSIESGKHKYVFEAMRLEDLVAIVTNDFIHQASERQITLQFTPDVANLPKVRADRDQVKWILNNLIENAIRYTPSGGLVRIVMGQAPGRVQVMVHDTGIGITPKDRNNIFERFYRAENAIAKENKGNGLGLYISRTIATDHGGDLNFAENTDGPGTTFTLSLPVAP